MRVALANTETFFTVSAGQTTDRVRRHIAAVDAAMAVGVERNGYFSFLRASPRPTAY